MAKHRTHWDHYFVQWCLHWLPALGLQAEGKPQFSQLPLEADILVIRPSANGKWQQDPIWQHVSPYTVVEFKSIHDPFQIPDWGKLMAYVGLTMEREKLAAETEIAGWLIVPYINRNLKHLLQLRQISLETLLPGLHKAHTGLFPLVIVEYNDLPLEKAFVELKTFMKKGSILNQVMTLALRKWQGSKIYSEYATIITSIHTEEAEAVIEILEQDKKKVKRVVNRMLERLGEEAGTLEFVQQSKLEGKLEGQLEGKRETARRMLADGLAPAAIARYTGLTLTQIQAL